MNSKRLLKAIVCVTAVLSMSACAKKSEAVEPAEEEKIVSYIEGASEVEMTYDYTSLKNSDGFMKITKDQLLSAIGNEDTNAIVYLGFSSCENCQKAIESIQEAAVESGQTIYYLDVAEELESDEAYDAVFEVLKPILVSYNTEDPTDVAIYTPHVFVIANGELHQGHVGYTENYDYSSLMDINSFAEE